MYKIWSYALCLILHCQSNGVFQEDILQVVIISGWWVSTNKLSLEFSTYAPFCSCRCVVGWFVSSCLNVVSELWISYWAPGWEPVVQSFSLLAHCLSRVWGPFFIHYVFECIKKQVCSHVSGSVRLYVCSQCQSWHADPTFNVYNVLHIRLACWHATKH